MTDPLASHEDRHATVKLELNHFTWGGMQVTAQVPQQSTSLVARPGTVPIAYARGALNAAIGTHVINQGYETVVQDREIPTEDLFGFFGAGAQCHQQFLYLPGEGPKE
jgi:hypothetical protein